MNKIVIIINAANKQQWLTTQSPEIYAWGSLAGKKIASPESGKTSVTNHSTAQHGTAQHSTAQHSTAQDSTAQHSTAHHSTAQHSAAQHSTARRLPGARRIQFKKNGANTPTSAGYCL